MSKRFLHPFRYAPVAIVVQAEVESDAVDPLKEVKEEAEAVAGLLFEAGYDVHLLSTGLYSEITKFLSDADIRERLVILHYCGHADGKTVELKNDVGSRMDVSVDALVNQMASQSRALRLVYMNACLTDVQEAAYRKAFPKVNFIGTKVDIPDWYAKKFALSFYRRFLGKESNFGQVVLQDALKGAVGEDRGWTPGRVDIVFQIATEAEKAAVVSALPDLNFRGDEGQGLVSQYVLSQRSVRSANTALLYALGIILIQFVFMWCAGGWHVTSSPAFQAAFGYPPDCGTISHMRIRLDDEIPLLIGENDACGSAQAQPLHVRSPIYGIGVEWARTILISLVLVFLCTTVYRRLPRDYPRVLTDETLRWLQLRNNRKFIILFVVGVVSVAAYHLSFAHWQLSETSLSSDLISEITWMQARWPVYACDPEIWKRFAALDEARQALCATTQDEFPKLKADQEFYHQLYVRPYLFYMGYSLVNYLASALPVLAVIVNGLSFGVLHMQMRLASLRVHARLARDGHHADGSVAEGKLQDVRKAMSDHFARFAWTFFALTLFAAYEIIIGKTTTALFAFIVMLLVFLLVVVGTASILGVWSSYREKIEEISEFINAIEDKDADQKLKKFERLLNASYFPIQRGSVITGVLGLILFAYLVIVIAEGSHWTPFTHDFPIFSFLVSGGSS